MAEHAIPRLVVRLNGVLQTFETAPLERLVIRLPPRQAADRKHDESDDSESQTISHPSELPTTEIAELDIPGNAASDQENSDFERSEEEGGGLIDEVDKFLDVNPDPEDDGYDDNEAWGEGETPPPHPEYIFCPFPHRKPILHLFTKHFCQHPLFPERLGGSLDAASIRRQAVSEMYQFCYQRGLREVWGYLWTSWYAPKVWKIWARSTSPYVSRLRTTMGTENFWRQLKHNYLHHTLRPRLDHLVWILINKVTPEYIARSEFLEDTHRLGRSKPLTTYQRYFKSAWKKLVEVPVSGRKYITSIEEWTCNCGQQKYHPQHLCKHLVQIVPPPPLIFWRQVIRRRAAPLYRHPALIPIDENLDGRDGVSSSIYGSFHNPDDGSITDGDDHVWLGDPDVLTSGEWRDFDIQGMLGKRSRSVMLTSVGDGLSSSAEQDMIEVHEQLNDPEDSDLENEVSQTHSCFRQIHHSP